MTRITTHVLDTTTGRPAAGITVKLEQLNSAGPLPVAEAVTDADGRVGDWLPKGVAAGHYRLVFHTGTWFRASQRESFYPEVVVHFTVRRGEPHYHVPLLVAPYGYSTYRGS